MTDTTTGPTAVTEAEFTAAMEAAIAERGPDWVYPRGQYGWGFGQLDHACLYVRADVDEPACIIGAVLHRLGFPLRRLREHEAQGSDEVLDTLLPELDPAVRSAASAAQDRQDDGFSWGYVLDAYRDTLAEEAERA